MRQVRPSALSQASRLILLVTALLLIGCASKKTYKPKTNPDFYVNVWPKFIFWSLESAVRVDIFVLPSAENCYLHLMWQDNRSVWPIDADSSRLQSRTIRLRDLSVGDQPIVAVVQKCNGDIERREFKFKVLEGVP